MKALLLAAGQGRRLVAEGSGLPKPMTVVAGKPILEYALEHVRDAGVTEVFINLHHRPDMIKKYFGDGKRWGVTIRYSFEPELLGTAGAVLKMARDLNEAFMVYYGDNLCACDLHGLQRYHSEKGGVGTIVIAESYDDLAGGIVECAPDGQLVTFLEKPLVADGNARWENAGIYILERKILSSIPPDRASDFAEDVFPSVLRGGERIYCYRAEGFVRGIDTPERYARVKEAIEQGRLTLK